MEVASRAQTRSKTQQFFGVDKQTQPASEESGTETESRARRKFQRATNANANANANANDNANDHDAFSFRKPSVPASAARSAPDTSKPLPSMANRRRSGAKENRVPLGPRPFESPSKSRVVSESTTANRSFLPTTASEPNFNKPVKSNESGGAITGSNTSSTGAGAGASAGAGNSFRFGSKGKTDNARHAPASSLGSFDFLPPVSFDDFHSSITSYESGPSPRLSDFPAPGSGGANIFGGKQTRRSSMAKTKATGQEESSGSDVPPVPSLNNEKKASQSFPRHYTNAARAAKMSSDGANNSAAPASRIQDGSLSLRSRTRNQSQTQTSAPSATASSAASAAIRQPRKSMGPGVLGTMLQNRRNQPDEHSANTSPSTLSNVSRTPSLSNAGRTTSTNASQPAVEPAKSHAMLPTRASRAKSVHQPLPRPNTLPDLSRPDQQQTTNIRASIKPKTPRTDTPSSVDKRKSGRTSGLGARTISPTDTARLRRLSMKQPPLTSPVRDTFKDGRPVPSNSPSLIPRMPSVTPSSARQTPESTPRSHLPSLSLSRSSSYQSLRAPSASSSSKIGQSASMSKLPTPKSRNVWSSADRHDGQEAVPPVPAIPKAYESPKDLLDTTIPFFAGVKTPLSESLSGSLDSNEGAVPRLAAHRRPDNPSTPSTEKKSHRRGLTASSAMIPDLPPALPPVNKKSLQPLRLPPLSLQPLSTPTAHRINSFPQPVRRNDGKSQTPSPKRFMAKTPSTPMTASKATFYKRYEEEQPLPPPPNLRSTSSNFTSRGGGYEEPNEGVPLPSPASRRGITPFTSGSLPKPGGHFNFRPRLPDEYTLGTNQDIEPPTSKPMGPRASAASKATKDSASAHTLSSNEEPDPPSSGNSLRRKLSLGWRRTSGKVPPTPPSDPPPDTPSKHSEMPPPKLPASATFAEFGSALPTVPQGYSTSAKSSLETPRRKPSLSNMKHAPVPAPATAAAPESTADAKAKPTNPSAARQMHSTQTAQRSTSWSILSSSNRTAAPKAAAQPSKSRQSTGPHLDKDDLIANEEMRRLSAKRRDVDIAARETDELRKHATRKDRMTPAQAIQSQTSAGLLNIFEKGEIVDFKEGVYFCGRKDAKKHVGDISAGSTNNFGYDDERGDYNIVMGDHLAYRYEVIDVLGKGSFGQVVRCIDHKHGGLCAVKIIRNKKRFHQQALVEVNILNKLREWDPDGDHATLTITSSFYFRSHLCITSPCLSINLYELIRAHGFTGFSLNIIRRFSRQMLTCLCLLQTKRIIHCDLKPENILLCDPRRADVRVIDFGSSCKADEKVYTYIQSRFYRSPEVILGSEYGLGIDMWSIGCILAELYTGYPIFPGENEQEQLACIMEIFGPPSRDIIEKCTRRKLFFDSSLKPRVTVSSKGRRRRPSSKTLSGALKCDDEAFLDFLVQCLRWDPEKRIRPDHALNHPFVTNEPLRRERPRTRAAVAAANGVSAAATGASASPIKRIPIANNTAAASSNTSIPSTANQTPSRVRPLPDTPATAIKGAGMMNFNSAATTSSPSKLSSAPGRRQSLAPANSQLNREDGLSRLPSANTNTSHALAGSKRTSNGTFLVERHHQQQAQMQAQMQAQAQQVQSGGYGTTGMGNSSLPRAGNGKVDLAGAAARESMSAVSRWR